MMKQTFFIVIASLFLFSACKQDPSPEKSKKEIAQEVSRSWDCKETGDKIQLNFKVNIKPDDKNPERIAIYNFHNIGDGTKIYANINTDLSLEIPEQRIDNQDIKGTGNIANDYTDIEIDYTIEDQLGEVKINAVYTYGSAPAK